MNTLKSLRITKEDALARLARSSVACVIGPSGVGKSTIIRLLQEKKPDTYLCVSATTRKPRDGEQDGVHYYFVSPERFDQLKADGEFFEDKEVHGNRYGTLYSELCYAEGNNKVILLDVDVQGFEEFKSRYPGRVVSVFLLPPSMAELEKRLIARGKDSKEATKRRLAGAEAEIARARELCPYKIVSTTNEEDRVAGDVLRYIESMLKK